MNADPMTEARQCLERLTLAAALLERFEGAQGGARYALEALHGSRTLAAAMPKARAVAVATACEDKPQSGGNARVIEPPKQRPPMGGANLLAAFGRARA